MTAPFQVLCADPPWQFSDSLPGNGRGAASHYATMSVDHICRFPLPRMHPDSVLFLWRVSAMQEEALKVMRAWGYELKTEMVWQKLTRTGKSHFGMGRIVRAAHETCLIGTRGAPRPQNLSVRSVFAAKVGEHSAKPEEFYELVEQLYPGPYVELFARRERKGWTTFGEEIGRPSPLSTY